MIARVKITGLKRARKVRKLSRSLLGTRAKVGHNTLFQAEHGGRINRVLAERLAKVLGVKLKSLQG